MLIIQWFRSWLRRRNDRYIHDVCEDQRPHLLTAEQRRQSEL
jgi:hypothetical protein